MHLYAVGDSRLNRVAAFNNHLNPFCRFCIEDHGLQDLCLKNRTLVCEKVFRNRTTQSVTCFAGLWACGLPVVVGGELVATLFLSGFSTQKSMRAMLDRTRKILLQMNVKFDSKALKSTYLKTPVFTPEQFKAMLEMLAVSCKNLAEFSNRRLVRAIKSEKPAIQKAKHYIQEHFRQPLTMEEVSIHAGLSATYFSKLFKKETSMPFPEYVNRVRIEQVKGLLLSGETSIHASAIEAGFESISHFNRVFRKYEGKSPADYRKEVRKGILKNPEPAL